MNTQLFLWVNDFARGTPWLHAVVVGYAAYGLVVFAALMVAGWWSARGQAAVPTMAAAIWTPLGMLAALGVNQPVADLVGEARPYAAMPGVLVLAHRSTDPSFPSDHAVMAGAVTAGLFLVRRSLGVIAAVAAVVMAFSRVYIAAHYPGDVLAGLVLGAVVSLAGYLVVRRPLEWLLRLAERSPLRPLLTTAPQKGSA
ncbi:phosphatase PAP2 family protein [Amycolatopsis tucumanensis]|uniref:Phosphatase PAP2 family protein n=1 Tax=Amycolatopsis tucumanensis TaxID=401106 RepID=A0ABP7HIB3_9PSEU|nr:phosphatase PAP2 family protein [Amycolatopsis tucumanensis]MCF6425444.1 phosphatase PAP2 family protein [Amycolatopsis tucumanensis]